MAYQLKTLERAQAAVRLRAEGLTLQQIGERLGVSATRVTHIIQTVVYGEQLYTTEKRRRRRSTKGLTRQVVLMALSGATPSAISETLGLSKSTVSIHLKRNGHYVSNYVVPDDVVEFLGIGSQVDSTGAARVGTDYVSKVVRKDK